MDFRDINLPMAQTLEALYQLEFLATSVQLYRPKLETLEQSTSVVSPFANLREEELHFEYEDPIETKAIITPLSLSSDESGAHASPESYSEPFRVLIQERNVPVRSYIEGQYYINQSEIRMLSLYLPAPPFLVGTAPSVIPVYFFIPKTA